MLINCMEVSGVDGTFRVVCERVMEVLRLNRDSLMAVLEAFVHDPLFNWRLVNSEPSGSKTKKNDAAAVGTRFSANNNDGVNDDTSSKAKTNKSRNNKTNTNNDVDNNNNNSGKTASKAKNDVDSTRDSHKRSSNANKRGGKAGKRGGDDAREDGGGEGADGRGRAGGRRGDDGTGKQLRGKNKAETSTKQLYHGLSPASPLSSDSYSSDNDDEDDDDDDLHDGDDRDASSSAMGPRVDSHAKSGSPNTAEMGSSQMPNNRAVQVIDRIQKKLTGQDFGADEVLDHKTQVSRLIEEATSETNLANLFHGWCCWYVFVARTRTGRARARERERERERELWCGYLHGRQCYCISRLLTALQTGGN